MELRRISDQGPESLVEYFEEFVQSKKMAELIRHIEQNLDAPMHWATTSHSWFYLTAIDHWDPLRARLFVYARRHGFEIHYRATEEFTGWDSSFERIHARDVVEATEAVEFALHHAVLNPPGRGEYPTTTLHSQNPSNESVPAENATKHPDSV